MHLAAAHTLSALAQWAEPWRREFTKSAVVSTGVLFSHVASIVVAGGLSLAADRCLLLPLDGKPAFSGRLLRERIANRRLAIAALLVAFASGGALFLSDVDSFLRLPTFWVKLSLVAMLAGNAWCAQIHDRRLDVLGEAGDTSTPSGTFCRVFAGISVLLWILTLLAGTALNIG